MNRIVASAGPLSLRILGLIRTSGVARSLASAVAALVLVAVPVLAEQPAYLVEDINPVVTSTGDSSNLYWAQELAGKAIFVTLQNSGCSSDGWEVWATDGTALNTTQLVSLHYLDVGGCSSDVYPVGKAAGLLYFRYLEHCTNRTELWRTDGTSAGTIALAELTGDVPANDPNRFADLAGQAIFSVYDTSHGYELWTSDGTPGGTGLLTDIYPGANSSQPYYLRVLGGQVYFRANDATSGYELWVTDGTAGGTQLVKDIYPGAGSSNLDSLIVIGSQLFFRANDGTSGYELWVTDGTAAGTQLVEDIYPGGSSGDPQYLTAVGSQLFFRATDGTSGYELWVTDGTAAGTQLVEDIYPGGSSSAPQYLTAVGSQLLFRATNATNGNELWVSDGTAAGTQLVEDIYPGAGSSSFDSPVVVGSQLFFRAWDGTHGWELWVSDGTAAGTQLVEDIYPGGSSSDPYYLTASGSQLFFRANDGTSGYEPWWSDGTAAGTNLIADLAYRTAHSTPQQLTEIDNWLYFTADDGAAGRELWRSHGAAGDTDLVADAHASAGSAPQELTGALGSVFFSADDGLFGRELWRSDGLPGGVSAIVADLHPAGSSSPDDLLDLGAVLLFGADDGSTGRELWASDGTGGGTVQAADIAPGPASSNPDELVRLGALALFSADDGVAGREPWVSDGTPAGTQLLGDLHPAGTSAPAGFHAALGRVFFAADNGASGREPWVSDGTPAGTQILADLAAVGSSGPTDFVQVGPYVLFIADDGVTGRELWRTDGSTAGTVLVKNIRPGGSSDLQHLVSTGTRAFFTADDGTNGRELWTSDGTIAGTYLVEDRAQNQYSINVPYILPVGELVYFWMDHCDVICESGFFRSDGAPGSIVLASPDSCGYLNNEPTVAAGRLFFSGYAQRPGYELFALDVSLAQAEIDFAQAASAVDEDAGTAGVDVVLTTVDGLPLVDAVTVEYATLDGSATAGDDYGAASGTLVFPAGSPSGSTQTITVVLLDDAIAEPAESFALQLSIAAPALTDDLPGKAAAPPVTFTVGDAHLVTIADDDSGGILVSAVAPSPVAENGGSAVFSVVLGSQPAANVTVALAVVDPAICTIVAASLTFTTADWAVPQPVTMTILDDAIAEPDKLCSVVTQPAASGDPFYAGFDAPNPSVWVADNDAAGISVTPLAGLVTDESGSTDQFTVVLTSQPVANVTVALASSDSSEATVPSSITFTPANWSVAQPVVVSGQPDAIADGDIAFTIATSVASVDPLYSVLSPADVAGTNFDDDSAGIELSQTLGLLTSEGGGSDSFTVVLDSEPTANVQVAIASTAAGEAVAIESSLLFTAGNWSVPQTVHVEGVDDPTIDGTQSFTIQVGPATSTDSSYAALGNQFAGGDNADDDVAGIAVTPVAGLQVAESGTTAQFNVVLNTQPGADVDIAIVSGDSAEVTVSDGLLTFTSGDWNVPQAVTLTGVDDAVVDGSQSVTITLAAAVSSDSNYSGLNPDDVAVDNADDDAAGILVTPVAGLETTEGLGTAQFTVVLTSQPASQVSVALQVSDATEGELLSTGSLDFGTGDWDQPQTVTVRGKNDDAADGDIPYEVEVQAASSTDPDYSGVDPDDVGLTNLDDDSSAILVSSASPSVLTEPASAATFTVALASEPAADVSVGLSSSDPSECLPSIATVLLTSANWATGVTVSVNAVDDLLADGTQPCTILTAAADSLDGGYDGVNPGDVALGVADNETAGITVTPTSPLETTEGGGGASFTIVLTSQPVAAVVVSLASDDLTEGSLSTTAVSFTTGNWNIPRSVTVFGVDDGLLDGDVAFSVETVVVSSDPVFAAIDPTDPALLNRDDEVDLSLVKDDGLTSIAAGETVTYTIVATNLGPVTVAGATVTDILPAVLESVSWTCSASPGSSCPAGGVGNLDETVSLAAGGTVSFSVSGDLPIDEPNGLLSNTAAIAPPLGFNEVAPGDNSDADTTTIVEVPEPQVTGIDTVRDTGDAALTVGEETAASLTQFYLTFSDDMADPVGDADPGDVTNPDSYRVIAAGPNGALETSACGAAVGDDEGLAIASVAYEGVGRTARLLMAGATSLAGAPHRVFACGSLTGENGLALDGDGNGTGGDSLELDFRVTATNRLANPNFDVDLSHWTVAEPTPGETQHGAEDADSKPTSGSAEIQTAAGAGQVYALSQCFELAALDLVEGSALVRLDSVAPGDPAASLGIDFYDAAACGGVVLASRGSLVQAGDTSSAFVELRTGSLSTPELALSARFSLSLAGGSAGAFTATWDNPFFGTPAALFADGFESNDTSAWSFTLP